MKNKKNKTLNAKKTMDTKKSKSISFKVKTTLQKHPKTTDREESFFSQKELEEIKKMLIEKRDALLGKIEDRIKYDLAENEVGDPIDDASSSLDKELLFGASENEKRIMEEIESALKRIDKGTYGKCEQCGVNIEKKRLKALPYSRYCVKCQAKNDSYR